MNVKKFNKFLPYIAAVILFLILSFAYFPEVLQGKKLNQHDVKTWKGGSKEIVVDTDYNEALSKGLRGTPSFFVNGKPMEYVQGLSHYLLR